MAHIEVNALSVHLSGTFDAHIFAPEPAVLQKKNSFPVLWMIHEDGNSPFELLRYTDILEKAATEKELFIIAPAVSHSLCTDMVWGTKNETFLGQECVGIFRFLYPLSTKREENIIFGIGSGGYGALKLAMHYPQIFGKGVSIDAELDIVRRCMAPKDRNAGFAFQSKASLEAIFGDLQKVAGGDHDLYALAEKNKTKLKLLCSTESKTYEDHVRFKKLSTGLETDFQDYGSGQEAVRRMLEQFVKEV